MIIFSIKVVLKVLEIIRMQDAVCWASNKASVTTDDTLQPRVIEIKFNAHAVKWSCVKLMSLAACRVVLEW